MADILLLDSRLGRGCFWDTLYVRIWGVGVLLVDNICNGRREVCGVNTWKG